ncbi:MAG: efflux RND transporter periplasmic adaptor subunit, partial [Planctomycetota bacterium]
ARLNGYVKEVLVDIGDPVRKGQVMAVIDVPELEQRAQVQQAQIKRDEASEQSAAAEVELTRSRIEQAEAKLIEAESQLAQVAATLAAAEAEFQRTEDLVQRGSLQSRMLDEARKRRDSERAAVQAVKSVMGSAEAEVAVARSQLDASQARRLGAAAESEISRRQLDEIEVLLDYASIRAPFDGIVTERFVNPGDLVVEEGSDERTLLYEVSQLDPIRIQVAVPEAEAAHVSKDDLMRVEFPSFASEPKISCRVTRTSGELDPTTRTMLVEAELDNSDGRIIPGMFGQATIELDAKVAANMLPARAVRFDASGDAFVYRIDEQDRVRVTPVVIGVDDGIALEILEGLESGERIVDAHLQRFQEGQAVAIQNRPQSANIDPGTQPEL